MVETISEEIRGELKQIRVDLDYLKEHMIDIDMVLTSEEEEKLETSLKEFKQKKTLSLEKLKKQLGA